MKLMQNRIVVVGRNPRDAHEYAQTKGFKDSLEAPVIVSAASHPLTIRGGLAGMHIAHAYVTPTAPEGEHYAVAEEMLLSALEKNPEMQIVEEPRKVSA